MKKFNVTGLCIPTKHYMVDMGKKIEQIMGLVTDGQYFTINRARQYGKTTALSLLAKALPREYTCINISFEGVGETMFSNSLAFCQRFLWQISKALQHTDAEFASLWPDERITDFDLLGDHLDKVCKDRKVVLMIDEVDRTSNNRVFLHFLGMLRSKYLERHNDYSNTFTSVILAGVHDVKNIKLKLANEGIHQEHGDGGRIYNSPWNFAAQFNVNMSFSPEEIATMLAAYEADHKTGMSIGSMAKEIFDFTSGYPFLVSRVCKCIDEELGRNWTVEGIQKAVKAITSEKNVLFDDLVKNLENDKGIYDFLYAVLIVGDRKPFAIFDPLIEWCNMFGYITPDLSGAVRISNKMFALVMSIYFISKDSNATRIGGKICNALVQEIIVDGVFSMELCLRKFAEHYCEIFSENDVPFLERHGRLAFLTYLSPLINGQGFYHIESQLTDLRRMDIVVNFGIQQFIIELKTWRGEAARDKAYDQLLGYMDTRKASEGYLLTFDFRKDDNKKCDAEWVRVGDRRVFDVVV